MKSSISALPEELLALIRHGENHQIEYKEARTELPKSIFDSVCAFSNRDGGDIFLGVHDTGVILGVDPASAAKLITNFVNLANNKDKLFPPLYLTARESTYTYPTAPIRGQGKTGNAYGRNPETIISFISMFRSVRR